MLLGLKKIISNPRVLSRIQSSSFRISIRFNQQFSNPDSWPESLPEDRYDIVINGGGIVGFSMLAAIKSSPFLSSKRVLLIEQQSPPPPRFFTQLKVWNELIPFAKKVQGMYVWSDYYQNGINFHNDAYSIDKTMCYILENHRMLQALYRRINELENPLQKVLYKTSVIDIQQTTDATSVMTINLKTIENTENVEKPNPPRTIQTRLLIGCDGFKSIVRSKSTLPYFEMDLEQMGIVSTLEIDSSNQTNQMAYQRFVDDKLVIGLLPLDENHSSLVLSVQKNDLSDWMSLTDEDFVEKLNNVLTREINVRNPLDKLASVLNLTSVTQGNAQIRYPPTIRSLVSGSRASYPLGFGTTVPFLVGNIQAKTALLQTLVNKERRVNTAIIGDAAHRIHPLAGQGLNLGLGDASCLTSCLEHQLSIGNDIFSPTTTSTELLSQALFEFERSRVLKLVPMLSAIHSMQTLFKYTPSVILPIFNQIDLIKNLIVSFANSR
ncbi:Ubiquinone biosynthesis monooxygenase COQ6 [Sarcoptes scabiei]|uniref:Ubiquinone biosynthesis monooxygenase COQ6, mitochondrial n=1 Tax=Sarcoptes scabiei TaxID=52283 RepID=A0A834VE13_SARSC|nr:Ubiquinone biosynthesis monooxygenase COQ6 [Sarcoptes scabiei]